MTQLKYAFALRLQFIVNQRQYTSLKYHLPLEDSFQVKLMTGKALFVRNTLLVTVKSG